MSLTVADASPLPPQAGALEPDATSSLPEKVDCYVTRLLHLAPLLASEVRSEVEGVLREHRDDLVRTILALREPARNAA